METKHHSKKETIKSYKWVKLSLYEILYLTVSIGGFFIIYNTLASTNKAIHTSIYSERTNWVIEIDKIFIEHSELRKYFYYGDSIKTSDTSYNKAESIAELMLDDFDTVLGDNMKVVNDDSKIYWENWIISSFNSSPLLCQLYERDSSWYLPEVKEVYQKRFKSKNK